MSGLCLALCLGCGAATESKPSLAELEAATALVDREVAAGKVLAREFAEATQGLSVAECEAHPSYAALMAHDEKLAVAKARVADIEAKIAAK